MDFYGLLSKIIENSTMGEPDKVAAREVLIGLKGVNAFGTVVAGLESESKETPHAHQYVTRWNKFEPNKIEDTCTICGQTSVPYEPTWRRGTFK